MRTSLMGTVVLMVAAASCAAPRAPAAGAPAADADSLVAAVLSATVPISPRQGTFTWRMDEAGSVVRGRGVVRYDAPDRMRLDLFGPRGETYLTAALVDGEFRLPPAATSGFELPSPTLLWGALGVLVPPRGATLESATTRDGTATIMYVEPSGGSFRFDVDLTGEPRLRRVERTGGSGALETVRIEHSADLQPSRTVYVDRRAFRELVLETESMRDVESFPESIWRPDGTADRP